MILSISISRIPEVVGALGWGVCVEEFADGVADRLATARGGLAQQMLELREDLLDGV